MADSQFVEHVRVVNRNIGHHDVGHQQLLEHIGADISRLHEDFSRVALYVAGGQRRSDQVLVYVFEINIMLRAERTNDKCFHKSATLHEPYLKEMGRNVPPAHCLPLLSR